MRALIAGSIAIIALSGCESIGDKTLIGAAGGAIAGAGVGVMAGGDDKRNAAVGAAIGAIAGGAVGVYMDKQEEELRRATAGTGIDVVRNGDQIALNMPSGITFDVNSSDVKPSLQPSLNDVAKTLVSYPKTTVDIVGHASSDGDDAFNQRLSERRAQSVQNYLVSQGIVAMRARAIGMGEAQPIADNATLAGRQANRRVEIVLTPVVDDGAPA